MCSHDKDHFYTIVSEGPTSVNIVWIYAYTPTRLSTAVGSYIGQCTVEYKLAYRRVWLKVE